MSAGQLSLYIDLEDGKEADLEAVARASLAFAATVRDIAAFLDPFSDTRVTLVSTTKASLSLNTKISFKIAGRSYEFTLRALIIVLTGYLATHVGDVLTERSINHLWEEVFGEKPTLISEEDKEVIAARAAEALKAKAGERPLKQMYAELDQDPAVIGVGVATSPGARPKHMVPRSEFPRLSGVTKLPEPPVTQRMQREILTVILVSPVLENDRKRRWKFKVGDTEFGAPIKDQVFLDAVFSGKHPLMMKGNVAMRVALEWQEDFIDGVWIGKKYVVWSVREVPGQYQGPQESFAFGDRPKAEPKASGRK